MTSNGWSGAGYLAAVFALVALTHSAQAEVKPAAIFGDHMVLQSGMQVPVWGTATPGETITVTVGGVKAAGVAGADGKWMVRLSKLKEGGPVEMTIVGRPAGSAASPGAGAFDTVTLKDVLVGEVWLGSGQSNMQFPVSRAHASYAGLLDEEKEIAAANYPQLRMFTVKNAKTYAPAAEVAGEWQVCTPAVVGDWSAVGYLFGRDLNQALKVPVGIVLSAYGASTAEAWVPREALASDPMLQPMLAKFDAREEYFKAHADAPDAEAPPAPQTLNARPPGPARAGAKPAPLRDPVQDQHQPTVLYNGQIAALIPYAMRGAIWYQGESIVGGADGVKLYPHTMETLVTEWRKRWGEGDFPFYVVQLAALKNVSNNPMVREQQAKILSLKNTGVAVTIDIGDPTNVHPKNKEPLGQRLADIALANAYGRKIEYSGPVMASVKAEGAAMRVRFTHAAGLKAAPTPNQLAGLFPESSGSAPALALDRAATPPLATSSAADPAVLADAAAHLRGFQVAGADQKFVDADAKIDGDSVVVSSPSVPSPIAVRYAWDNYPNTANLYNAAGLPTAPFRTDPWDALTPVAAAFTGK